MSASNESEWQFDAVPIDPGATRWPVKKILHVVFWVVLAIGFVVLMRLEAKLAWAPTALFVADLVRGMFVKRQRELAARKAVKRLQVCFTEEAEPDLVAIFAVMDGLEEVEPINRATQWSQRFQLGMIGRDEYYAGMRAFLARHAAD